MGCLGMKKQKNILLVLVLMFIFSSLLIGSSQPVESGVLTFLGKIEPGLYFSVSEIPTDSFNLLTEEDLQPKGPGVDIGTWTLRIDNPPTITPSFTIQYTFASLASTDSEDEIEFEILERTAGLPATSASVKKSTHTTIINIGTPSASATSEDVEPELYTYTKTVAARLTSEGVESALVAAASLNYQSNITITLLAE